MLESPWTNHGTWTVLRACLFCPVGNVLQLHLETRTKWELWMHYMLNVGGGQTALSLFGRTKLGNQEFLLLLCAKGHRSWETDEVIDLRTQTKFVAKVRTMMVLLIPAQHLDSKPSSPQILLKLKFILKQCPLLPVFPFFISLLRSQTNLWLL